MGWCVVASQMAVWAIVLLLVLVSVVHAGKLVGYYQTYLTDRANRALYILLK
ncbi:Uncharacterised protein [Candidatus Burarchaeum australiense]|nr:Uncharacterised protein [Candidatus Burarchaeum australiense]